MNVLDLITGDAGTRFVDFASEKFGLSKEKVSALNSFAVPLIIGKLEGDARKDKKRADHLFTVVKACKDKVVQDFSLIDDHEGQQLAKEVFGQDLKSMVTHLASRAKTTSSDAQGVLYAVTPLVMGFIAGRQKKTPENTLDKLLTEILEEIPVDAKKKSTLDYDLDKVVLEFLDADGDGSMIDDFFDIFTRKRK